MVHERECEAVWEWGTEGIVSEWEKSVTNWKEDEWEWREGDDYEAEWEKEGRGTAWMEGLKAGRARSF